MAIGYLPEPGTKYGPCLDPCEHVDCAATRRDLERPCAKCGEPIGLRGYYVSDDSGRGMEHAVCLEEAIR